MSQDLTLIPTQDLFDELFGRFDHAVFKGRRQEKGMDSVAMFDWRGEHAICLGMLSEIAHDIHKDQDDKNEKLEELP